MRARVIPSCPFPILAANLDSTQARGWATEVCAGVDEDGYSNNSCCALFTCSITLTEAGLAAGPGWGLAPVALLFEYLSLLASTRERGGSTAQTGGGGANDSWESSWCAAVLCIASTAPTPLHVPHMGTHEDTRSHTQSHTLNATQHLYSATTALSHPAAPQERVWTELKGIADMKFRFLEEEDSCDYVTRLAGSMHLHKYVAWCSRGAHAGPQSACARS